MKAKYFKIYILVISLCTGLSANAHDFEIGGIYYNVISKTDKKVEVTSNDNNYNSYSGDIAIPAEVEYDNLKFRVTSIGYYAFGGCPGLTSIQIPDGVTSIGSYAFGSCTGLTSVIIPDGVTSIGSYAFGNCTGLTSIRIPDGVTSIDSNTFTECSGLVSVILPHGVTSIGYGAFYKCSRLASVIIPESVTYIGERAFQYCTVLSSIILPDGITHIGPFAFSDCSALVSIILPDRVTHIDCGTFAYCKGLTSVIVPDQITYIASDAFLCCSELISVSLGEAVNEISSPFSGCINISQFRVFNPIPPKCSTNSFSDINKINCTLFVPKGSKEAFSHDPEWGVFFNIEEFETGGVNGAGSQAVKVAATGSQIIITGAEIGEMVTVYSATGQQIYQGTQKTIEVHASGLYFVKVTGKICKIVI
jgi:probable cell surface protein (leucine-rich repeat protein)